MKKSILYTVCSALLLTAVLPMAANADDGRGHREDWRNHHWREHDEHRGDWYYHPRWVGNRYVVAPVPPPVVVSEPYYYVPPQPVYYPQPGLSINIR